MGLRAPNSRAAPGSPHSSYATATAYTRMVGSTVPKLFSTLPKFEFGENASHNNPSVKLIMKKIMIVLVIFAVSC